MSTTRHHARFDTARAGVLGVARKILDGADGKRLARPAADGLFFSLKSDRFLQTQNLSLVLQQVMVVGVLAIGQTLMILTAASTSRSAP